MRASIRRALLIALVPALAFAGGKAGHRKPKATTRPAATEPKPADPTPPTPTPTPTPAATTPAAATPATPAAATPAAATTTGGGGGGAATGATASGGAADDDKPASANEPDVDALRQEYLSLRDELFKSRARANAVASQLYSTRVTIHFTWTSGRYYGVTKAQVRLDGATVYEDTTGAVAGDDGVRFDGYVAPGRHLVTFHVEATGKDDDSFTSSTESQVVVKAVANKDLVVHGKGHDAGDIAYEWKKSEHGSYGLGIDVAVKTVPHSEGAKK